MMSEEAIRRNLDAVVSAALVPTLSKLENQTGQRIGVTVQVARPLTTPMISCSHGNRDAAVTGEIRIVLKESVAGKIRFSCQAIIRGLMPSTGFSGFSVDGNVDLAQGKDNVRLKGCTYRYNQWEWRPEFMLT